MIGTMRKMLTSFVKTLISGLPRIVTINADTEPHNIAIIQCFFVILKHSSYFPSPIFHPTIMELLTAIAREAI